MFSNLMKPLLVSFNNAVGLPESFDDMNNAARSWVNQHLRLVQLRPMVTASLKQVAIQTAVLERPSGLPQEAVAAAVTSQTLWTGPPSKRRRVSGVQKFEQGDDEGEDL